MTCGVSTAHRRADCAVLGATAIAIVCAIPFAFNLYTDENSAAIPMAQADVAPPSAVQLAAVRFAADVGCLAEVMYYEARGEGVAGEKAVAEVVLQRTRDRNFPHTICGVVHDRVQEGRKDCQFSFACNGSADKPKEPGTWSRAYALAENIVSGTVKLANQTGHAIAYHNVGVSPAWAETMQRTAQIGNHIFYRWAPRVAPAATANSLETSISVEGRTTANSALGAEDGI